MATIPTPEQGKPILDFSAGTFDGNSNLFQSRNGATEHVNGDDVADYVNTSRIYNGLRTTSKTSVGAINEVNDKEAGDIPYDNTSSGLTATDAQGAIDELASVKVEGGTVSARSSEPTKVMFTNTYTQAPHVAITPYNTSTPRDYVRTCCLTAITTTYFEFVEVAVKSDGSFIGGGIDRCEWVAYGV